MKSASRCACSWRRIVATAIATAGALTWTGCSRSEADDAHARETEPAATYKAGFGLRLSEAAAVFSDLRVDEVAARDLPGAPGAIVVPESAVLRTVRGAFVYVENGGWLLRSPVSLGVASGGWVEVKDGLYEGDRIAVAGVQALCLAEISAINGGVGCADGH